MDTRANAFLRHQQQRWLRADAARWVRPDAAKFLKPGTRLADIYPALAFKYNPDQPRVPAGNGRDSGRWGDGGSSGRPRVYITGQNDDGETLGDGGTGVSLPSLSFDVGDLAWRHRLVRSVRRQASQAPQRRGQTGGRSARWVWCAR